MDDSLGKLSILVTLCVQWYVTTLNGLSLMETERYLHGPIIEGQKEILQMVYTSDLWYVCCFLYSMLAYQNSRTILTILDIQ